MKLNHRKLYSAWIIFVNDVSFKQHSIVFDRDFWMASFFHLPRLVFGWSTTRFHHYFSMICYHISQQVKFSIEQYRLYWRSVVIFKYSHVCIILGITLNLPILCRRCNMKHIFLLLAFSICFWFCCCCLVHWKYARNCETMQFSRSHVHFLFTWLIISDRFEIKSWTQSSTWTTVYVAISTMVYHVTYLLHQLR